MAERKASPRISHAEIKAGVFLTFCLALFISMLFVLGKFGRSWRGRQEIRVAFTQVNAVRPEAPVRYNGMDVGHVKKVRIVRVDPGFLEKLPPIERHGLENLPLDPDEIEKIGAAPDDQVDALARAAIAGRSMVLLTLDLLAENDTQRYREDDEYRIAGSLVGDSSLEIRTGKGRAIPAHHDRLFLGVGGDMYSDLGSSISQVKDILASMAEMVGGDASRQNIQGQIGNFERFTGRMDAIAESMGEKLPKIWDSVDERVERGKATLQGVEDKITGMKPRLEETLKKVQESVLEVQQNTAASVQELHDRIAERRKNANESLQKWKQGAAEYKNTIPEQVANAREWSDRFAPTVDKIDSFFTRADDQLNKGTDSTRAALRGYIAWGESLEAASYRMKRWPWSYANKPTDEIAQQREVEWRRDLARRHYAELRKELERVRKTLAELAPSDRARLGRIDQLIRESDLYLEVGGMAPAPAEAVKPAKKKGK